MLAALSSIAAILGALSPVIGLVVKFLTASNAHAQDMAQQATGAQLEAGAVNAASLKTETAIADAEAAAPADRLSVIDQWKAGAVGA